MIMENDVYTVEFTLESGKKIKLNPYEIKDTSADPYVAYVVILKMKDGEEIRVKGTTQWIDDLIVNAIG